MRILILGGSNSLMAGGYVTQLRQSLQGYAEADIVQLSVGATTTLSAIGRLHETFSGQHFDVVLYEYSINDTGHFARRAGGDASWLLCLHLLLKTLGKMYPAAVFVPLVLALRQHFPVAVPHPLYDAQLRAFAALGLVPLDMRQWLSELFLGKAPDWLYSDEAHYAVPHATSLVGAMLARHLLTLAERKAETIAATCERLRQVSPHAGLELIYLPAINLQSFCTGPVQAEQVHNRLMRLDYLRMAPGSRLALSSAMFPLVLFLKADACHDAVQLELTTAAGIALNTRVATRHADTADYPFIYTSIPLPLLWNDSLLTPFVASTLALSVPDQAGGAQVGFDCFGVGLADAPARHLDLVGVLMVAETA